MAAVEEATTVTYEQLADIEREFDDVETEIIRQQVQLTKSLYAKRHRTVAQIPNFWPLVLEQAPPDIDQHIQPSDSALLLSSLTALTVTHFELEATNADRGDPRSVAIRWEFAQNAYFEDAVLEKRFWHRRTRDGWAGLVSEPVAIRWKKGKDLTGGLLDMVKRVWDEEQLKGGKAAAGKTKKRAGLTAEQRALKRKIEDTGLGGLSFFAWFGYVGRRVSAAENELALAKEEERRKLRREGKPAETTEDADENEDAGEDEEDEEDESLEIFPDGDELAIAITQDLWPGAIKYFTQAQEQDALSDDDFESDDEGEDGAGATTGGDDEERPPKKRKA